MLVQKRILLLNAFLWSIFSLTARGAFPLQWKENSEVKVQIPVEIAEGDVYYDCNEDGFYSHKYEKLADGNIRRSGSKVEANLPVVYQWTFTKSPWNLLSILFDTRGFSLTGEVTSSTILSRNFDPAVPFTTGKIYKVVGKVNSNFSESLDYFEMEFWFEQVTLNVPGYGPTKGYTATTLLGSRASQAVTKYFIDSESRKLLMYSQSGSVLSGVCFLR